MSKNIDDLQKKVVAFRDARDWKQFHTPKDMAISLSLEASELLEHFQWKNEEQAAKHVHVKKSEVSDELADVLYWVLLIANDLEIDLPKHFIEKLDKNDKKYPVEKSKGTSKKYTELK